jgi:molecular chaperone DnaJ
MKIKNYYNILGVKRTASSAQIQKRFKVLAQTYHPDKTGGSEESQRIFTEILEAYQVLGTIENRLKYAGWFHAYTGLSQSIELRDYEYRMANGISPY